MEDGSQPKKKKKRHKLKANVLPVERKEELLGKEYFDILAADLSLYRPAWAVIRRFKDGSIQLVGKVLVDNSKNTKKIKGQILSEIEEHLSDHTVDVYVRERGLSRFNAEVQALFRVVGISDLVAWRSSHDAFFELAPASVKKLITGNGKASKEQVASCLETYIGNQDYLSDDESDACAVGIAWLIDNGFLEPLNIDN